MMRFLLSNDDGIDSQGIHVLAGQLAQFGQVILVAPDAERSGFSHAVTTHQALTLTPRPDYDRDHIQTYQVSGTPADCVMVGLSAFFSHEAPDFVVSGINRGSNVGQAVMYSGTVGAGREGINRGIPSIAFSAVRDPQGQVDYPLLAPAVFRVLDRVFSWSRDPDVLLNVNLPALGPEDSVPDIQVVPVGLDQDLFEAVKEGEGYRFSVKAGAFKASDQSDYGVVMAGKIAVSPIHLPRLDPKIQAYWAEALEGGN